VRPAGLTTVANAARRLAPSSFFGQFFTGVIGGLAPISISVGISYFASLSVRSTFSSSMLNGVS
jgi:hypothetical protein